MIRKKYIIAAVVIGLSFMLAAICVVLMMDMSGGDGRPKLVFTSHSSEKVYDGTELKHHSYVLTSGKLDENAQITASFSGVRLNAGTASNDFVVKITLGGQDISEDYNIEYRLGNLTVNPLPLAVLSGSAQKVYDGLELKEETYEIASGELLENHVIVVDSFSSITDAGTTDNKFLVQIFDGNTNITTNYAVEKQLGVLSVIKKDLTVRSGTSYSTYDGKSVVCHESSHSEVLAGHEVRVEFLAESTDAGSVSNDFGATVFDGERDVTNNYEILKAVGDIIILPRPLAIRSDSAKKIYDGEPLVCDEYDIVSSPPLDNHTVNVIISGTQTEIGASPNYIAEVTLRDENGINVTHNYLVEKQNGTLYVYDPDDYPNSQTGNEIDTSGKISSDLIDNDATVAQVFSQLNSTIYLKKMSFGDYNGNFWSKASDYPILIAAKYSYSYLSGMALRKSGELSHSIAITPLTTDYLLPFYLEDSQFGYEIQVSDTIYNGDTSAPYSLYFYDYIDDGIENVITEQHEYYYYQYTLQNYLNLDQSTRDFFRAIIGTQGFVASDINVIAKVSNYIKNSAEYNESYPVQLDSESNIAVKFLSQYKQGICTHFASAAVLLYRALGIPARYTIGYVGQLKKNENVSINSAHAYVEVYVKGFGWVMVEVTPSGAPSKKEKLVIKPVDVSMKYLGGTILYPVNEVEGLEELTSKSFSYSVTVGGQQMTIGIGKSTIESFTLFDPYGNDVTDRYEIEFLNGKMHMYAQEITVRSKGGEKIYDGLPLIIHEFEIDKMLASVHTAKAVFEGSQTVVGRSQNSLEIKIFNGTIDETYVYKINYVCGDLKITPRSITIIAGSSEKSYDGLPLTCNEFQMEGTLATDDRITVIISGSLTGVGTVQNSVTSVKITTKDGKDVTNCYSINTENGELTVTIP